MLPHGSRYVRTIPLLLAVCGLTLCFPTQTPTPPAIDNVQHLEVNGVVSSSVVAPLGSSVSIPCSVFLSSSSPATSSTAAPRIKWSVVSGDGETEILVQRGDRVKVTDAYKGRAWLNDTSFSYDNSLWLGDLRSSDSGHYRCKVQQGLEDATDLIKLNVIGVVFHYRAAAGRYMFSFHEAKEACEAIGAQIATPDQLLASYHDGYEQCDAGWLADQSVRYPIQRPRKGCEGDMHGNPGVRNYGTRNLDDLYDVYCFIDDMQGEVLRDTVPQRFSFEEAQNHCRERGAQLATPAQLYLEWSKGLDRCSPGWLSDGSVRYPITAPRERCGGPQAGVKTVYRFRNQTGFPHPSSLHDVYCFKRWGQANTDSPLDSMVTESEEFGQNVVILMEADQELQLNPRAEQVELKAQRVVASYPINPGPSDEADLVVAERASPEFSIDTTRTTGSLQAMNEVSFPTEMTVEDPERPTALMSVTTSMTETYAPPQSTSSQPIVYNQTDPHQSLLTFSESEHESTTEFPKSPNRPHTQNQTVPNANLHIDLRPSESTTVSEEMSSESNLDFGKVQDDPSDMDPGHTQGERPRTPMPTVQEKQEEEEAEKPVEMYLSTQAFKKVDEFVTQVAQTTAAPIIAQTLVWEPLDGSGDESQENGFEVDSARRFSTSPPHSFTTLPSPSASASIALTDSHTASPGLTHSSAPNASGKVRLDAFPTASQEGSASSENEDTIMLESEENRLNLTNLYSGISLVTAEPLEESNTSQVPVNNAATDKAQTPGYGVYLDIAATEFEEASGHEVGTAVNALGTDVQILEFPQKIVNLSDIKEGQDKLNVTFQEEVAVYTIPEEELKNFPTSQIAEAMSSLENDIVVVKEETTTVINREQNAFSTPKVEGETIYLLEEDAHVTASGMADISIVQNLEDKEEAVTPTIDFEQEANISSIVEGVSPDFAVQAEVILSIKQKEEYEASPTHNNTEVVSSVKEEVGITPNVEGESRFVPTVPSERGLPNNPTLETVTLVPEFNASIVPTLKDETMVMSAVAWEENDNNGSADDDRNLTTSLDEEANVASILEEEATATPKVTEEENGLARTLEDDVNVMPTFAPGEEANIIPTSSEQTSNGHVSTTTSVPSTPFNNPDSRRKFSSVTTHATPDSSSKTKPTVRASTKTLTTTTHWSKRAWSPTTPATMVSHRTAEAHKVTTFMPPVDHGAADLEFSLTHSPNLLILPNEGAAVGGTGKTSVSDACTDDPCLNGGTCTERNGHVHCLCLPTYAGDFCQTDVEECEPGWDKFQGFCYRHFGQRLSWEVAEQHCRMLGAHLVSIMTPEEQNYINSNYKEYQWTGLNDKTIEDDFRWSDGNPLLYENWYRGQPDSYFLSGEDCVVMVWHDGGRWSDVPCNYHLAYTCKKGTTSCGPPPKVRHASIFGKVRQRYETNAVVRYHCASGFRQRLSPLVRCLSGGIWEMPKILCINESGGPTQEPDVMSQTKNKPAEDSETSEEPPQYWDIRF